MSILNNIDSMILYEGWLDSFGVSTKFFSDLESEFKKAAETIESKTKEIVDNAETIKTKTKEIVDNVQTKGIVKTATDEYDKSDPEVKNAVKSFANAVQDEFKALREEIFIGRSPEMLQGHVRSFFSLFNRNPVVDKLVELSGSNPYILFAILSTTLYTLGLLLVFGWKNIREKISKYNVSSSELSSAEKTLTNAKTESEKKAAIKQIANLGAKHLVYQKFNKA